MSALKLIGALVGAVIWVDSLACRALPYKVPRDLVLDSLLGPAEEIEYARTTAPTV